MTTIQFKKSTQSAKEAQKASEQLKHQQLLGAKGERWVFLLGPQPAQPPPARRDATDSTEHLCGVFTVAHR